MQTVLPLLGIFAVFSPALMLPGPDFVAVVRNTIARGRWAGVMTALGVSLGITLYAGISAAGLATLLARIQWFELIVRLGGAAFLGYLGLRLLTARKTPRPINGAVPAEPDRPREARPKAGDPGGKTGSAKPDSRSGGPDNPLLMGLLVNLTNPKAIVFFASIFGTAIKPGTPPWILAAVVAVVGICGLAWFSAVSLLTASTGFLVSLEDHQHWIERLAGVAFLGFAAKLVFDVITR